MDEARPAPSGPKAAGGVTSSKRCRSPRDGLAHLARARSWGGIQAARAVRQRTAIGSPTHRGDSRPCASRVPVVGVPIARGLPVCRSCSQARQPRASPVSPHFKIGHQHGRCVQKRSAGQNKTASTITGRQVYAITTQPSPRWRSPSTPLYPQGRGFGSWAFRGSCGSSLMMRVITLA